MLQSFFTGLSGLFSFSKNLDTVSNNIANMNTPGYKGADTFYKSLTGGDGNTGVGTQVGDPSIRFQAGDIQQSSKNTDLAISGEGFFVLLGANGQQFTRAGQFEINQDGLLIDKSTGNSVGAINESGQVQAFDISNLRVLPPKATSQISLSGNLSSGATSHEINGLTVFNALGEEIEVSLKFTNNNAVATGSWLVEIQDLDGNVLGNGEVRYGVDGTPQAGFNSVQFTVEDSLLGTSNITIDFGEVGNFSGSTSIDTGTTSSMTAKVDDGASVSALTGVSFNSDGTVKLTYANGETQTGPRLAIATFADQSQLKNIEGSIYIAPDAAGQATFGAGDGGAGNVLGQNIELSNVDLSKEFADMLIIQRGYQASSRILNVANQLLEQLYESTRGR
ncbi:flagellar basal-body rod protein FlgF [Colwellia sp. MEBiC06753]